MEEFTPTEIAVLKNYVAQMRDVAGDQFYQGGEINHLRELFKKVDTLQQNQNPLPGNTIGGPIDPLSRGALNGITCYPAIFKLKDTEAQTAANYNIFFVADRAFYITSVAEVHGTLGTDAGAVTLQLEKLTGTTAAGSGTNILTTAFNLKGTINTPQYGAFSSVAGAVALRQGDRLAAKSSGTLTAVKNVVMVVYMQPF